MDKITLIVILLSCTISVNSQIMLEGKIIDADSEETIPYVNIGITKISKGTVSDFEGRFQLNASSNDDEVSFSSIGYETLTIEAGTLKNQGTIKLKKKEYEIEEIEVKASRFEEAEIMLGVKNDDRGLSIGFGSAQLGTEIGTKLEVKKATYIKSANFVLNHAKGDSLLFRVNLYDLSEGKVGENLLKENIFIKEKQKKGVITVNLEGYNIILKSDVLLTLEWLRNFDETGNKEITFDTKKSGKMRGIFVKYSSNGNFARLSHNSKSKPCFYLIGKQLK